MKICSTYGKEQKLEPGMNEIRMDVFSEVPRTADGSIITLCGHDPDVIPKDFKGLIDNGQEPIEGRRCIKSVHDFESTPTKSEIIKQMAGTQEISKGAYMVNSFRDLHSIYAASQEIRNKHVLIGMGDTGTVTRIRSDLLDNEFTFGYVGEPTAPGQLSKEELESLENCHIVGITGNPVGQSKSPEMQKAAMKALGIKGAYLKFNSPNLDLIEDVMTEYRILGMNVTSPHKRNLFGHLDDFTETAMSTGSVNTVLNVRGWISGYNTDVAGIEYALGYQFPENALILGSGGAARSAAYCLKENGCHVSVKARNKNSLESLCRDLGVDATNVSDVRNYEMVINCTPIGMTGDEKYPIELDTLTGAVFDMVYHRKTLLQEVAESRGCPLVSGKDMLVGQGAESFKIWFKMRPDTRIMRSVL